MRWNRFFRCLFCLVFFFQFFLPSSPFAAPLTTKYFSLELPPDWIVLEGPKKEKGLVRVHLGSKDHSSSVQIMVMQVQPGDVEKAASSYAKRLKAGKPRRANGQLVIPFTQQGIDGYCLLREDSMNKLMLVLAASGDLEKIDFVYQMRGPYQSLKPVKP